ncbi:MAG TPA: tetratricopeptide repeat protein [Gammaproteobacteria bacterium]|nr:tetratricopeptide repeat protein [Gammaproteobacteria bacterium]
MRRTVPLFLALAAAGCGSRPVQVPATVTQTGTYMSNAMLAYSDNRYVEARTFFGRALMQYRSLDDLNGEAETLIDMADCALLQGDVPAARDYLAEAHSLVTDHKPLAALASRVTLLDAYADLQTPDPAAAAAKLDGLLNDATTPADVHSAALFARTQAAFDLKADDTGQWLAKLNQAVGQAKDDLTAARLERLQAKAETEPTKAEALYADALAHYQTAYYRPGIAAAHEEWGGLLLSHADWSGARDHLRRALQVRLWMYDSSDSLRMLDELAQADQALGDADAAKQDAALAKYLKDGGDPSQSLPPSKQ